MAGEWIVNDKEHWEDADGINAKELGRRLLGDITRFGSSVKESISETFRKEDDNIEILDGTKTLLGDDFTTLYESHDMEDCKASDGTVVKSIRSTSSYDTEMHSGMCSAKKYMSYDLFSDKEKAMYEITLLSKYYANEFSDDSAKNEMIAQEYANKMVEYRRFCDQNNISWSDVCVGVDIELQTECANYLRANEQVLNSRTAVNANDNRIITNRAHGLLLQCVPDDYIKMVCPSASVNYPELTFEDTLDTSTKYSNFLVRMKDYFVEKWNTFKEYIPKPIKSLKTCFVVATDELGKLMDDSVENAKETQQEMYETYTDTKEKSEDFIEDVKDKTQERLDKFRENDLPEDSGNSTTDDLSYE